MLMDPISESSSALLGRAINAISSICRLTCLTNARRGFPRTTRQRGHFSSSARFGLIRQAVFLAETRLGPENF